MKQAITRIAASALLAFIASTAHAQSAGSFYVTTGWLNIAPQSHSDPLDLVSSGGVSLNQTITPSGASVDWGDTLGLALGYFVTDHIAAEVVGGVPPRFDIDGTGELQQAGGAPLAHANLWSPTVLLKYYFNQADAKFRPYVGLGASYIWFNDAKITGVLLSPELTPQSIQTSRQWSPVFNAGFNYNFNQHWFAGVSLSYLPFGVNATITASSPVGSTVVSKAHISLDPIVTYFNVGYRF
jgi:outer membrane protein